MIPRYSTTEMSNIWADENKYNIWFKIEAYACLAMAEIGVIPKESAENILKKGKFDIKKIDEIEKVTKHDVIAFLTNLSEYIGEDARFVHQGMTSSDVLDTCLNVQLTEASDLLITKVKTLLEVLKRRAFETKYLVTIGRSHGIHAEPTTFGLKFASFYAEFKRNLSRLELARQEIATCAISGAVGTFANINPFIEQYVADRLSLTPEPISTQIIPRDRHAMFFATLGVIASSIERIATEIRHLQRTEVLEAEEYFAKGQKGSSAMPHKRNPVLSENLCGLARVIRGYVTPALENVALWHERDISHSSVERMIAPDATITLDFALTRLISLLDNLIIHEHNVQKNLNKLSGLIFSQRVLLALTQKNCSREYAYELVQKNSMKVWDNQDSSLLDLLKHDLEIQKYLSKDELEELFDIGYHTKNVDIIFQRVFS